MALCELHFFSRVLGQQTAANVLLPQTAQPGPFPVFYLLHGLSDDHSSWARRTSLERYVEGWPLIVVMPNGGRGFYTDALEGFAYESALVRELVPFIDRMFNTRAERAGRVIGGLSMGGYGAIKLALKFPELFCAATSHSGALTKAHFRREEETEEFDRIFGRNAAGGADDIFALAEKMDRGKFPALRFDCGTEDFLLERSREFHAHLESLHLPHEYAEFLGDHAWSYWDEQVQEAIAFHGRHLGIRPAE